MTELLDGTKVPWHFVSGKREPGVTVSLPAPARRDPQSQPTSRRLVAGGLFIASALAEQMRRFK